MDESNKESARERATRRWHNNYVMKKSQQATEPEPQVIPIQSSAIKKEILSIITTRTNETLQYYWVALNERRRKLLKEKLKRLMENNSE